MHIKRSIISALVAATLTTSSMFAGVAMAQQAKPSSIKTRLDHLSGTPYVLVISYLHAEITSITCESWTMLGVGSWKDQNNFTIPTGPAVAIMNANKFNGYCKNANSIVAHTDDGDFIGQLDRGAGNWDASTKLTFLDTNFK